MISRTFQEADEHDDIVPVADQITLHRFALLAPRELLALPTVVRIRRMGCHVHSVFGFVQA